MITEIFGENCLRAKVFDLLLSHPHIDYNISEIAECANVSRGSLNKFIDQLVGYQIIIPTRKIGNSTLYKINLDSPITQALNSFQNQLADIEMEKEMKELQKVDPEIVPIRPFEEMGKNFISANDYFTTLKKFYQEKKEVMLPELESTGATGASLSDFSCFGSTNTAVGLTATVVDKKIEFA